MEALFLRSDLIIRDAEIFDVDALAALRGPRALHDDRVWGTWSGRSRYLIAVNSSSILGWEVVLLNDAPLVVDLYVAPPARSQGVGSTLLRAAEQLARQNGFDVIALSADPTSRALALYQRLGYQQIQQTPYLHEYRFEDSAGNVHAGSDWVVDLKKCLTPANSPPTAPPAPSSGQTRSDRMAAT